MLTAFQEGESDQERGRRIAAAMHDEPERLLAECEEHMAYAGNNYLPFMLAPYKAQRSMLLNCLRFANRAEGICRAFEAMAFGDRIVNGAGSSGRHFLTGLPGLAYGGLACLHFDSARHSASVSFEMKKSASALTFAVRALLEGVTKYKPPSGNRQSVMMASS